MSATLANLSFRAKRGISLFVLLLPLTLPLSTRAQQPSTLAASIQKIIDRPEFRHANFAIEFYDLATNTVVYSLNPHKPFTPASTTKLLIQGSILAKLRKDYRFHT